VKRHYDAFDPQCDDGEDDRYSILTWTIIEHLPKWLNDDGVALDEQDTVIRAGEEIENLRAQAEKLRAERNAALSEVADLLAERDAYSMEATESMRQLQRERDEALRMVAKMTGALEDIADSEDEHGVPSSADWMSGRAAEVLRECVKEKR
jgi:seryl-tRNA synthetase